MKHHHWLCLIVPFLASCTTDSADEQPDTAATPAVADTSSARVDSLLPGFDPGGIAVGDTVFGLRVVTRDVSKAFEDSVWVGTVKFAGELELRGVYQGHFDYPEVSAVCFHVTDSTSVRRVPRFAPDQQTTRGKTWFCFDNAEAATAQLGPPDQAREATIVVDDFTAVRHFTDAVASARLVRVVQLGGPASRTLREAF